MTLPPGVQLKEKSILAKWACWYLKSGAVAMVWGSTIHLWGASSKQFLQNKKWVRHELKHVEQFKELGIPQFLLAYLWQWMLHGYRNNKFEIAARAAEQD